jgi:hypothetical protein
MDTRSAFKILMGAKPRRRASATRIADNCLEFGAISKMDQ